MIEIPLTSDPSQEFSIDILGVTYDFVVVYNSRTGVWSFSLASGGVSLADNIGIVGGVDLLNQYNFTLTRVIAVNLDDLSVDASSSNLGSSIKLMVIEDSDLDG